VDNNIQEIQELYKNKEQEKESNKGRVEDKEVILIRLYEVLELTSSSKSSFIDNEVDNLIKYMKFICSLTQTRLFQPPLHYQSLKSRGEQDSEFWKEIATALVKNKHNTEISWNDYPIAIYQGGPPHELYFIAINNRGQVIIGPNKKMVAIYVVGELEVLIWFMRTWILKREYYYNWYLLDTAWTRIKDNDNMIGYAKVISVSISYSRCSILAWSLLFYDSVDLCTTNDSLMLVTYI